MKTLIIVAVLLYLLVAFVLFRTMDLESPRSRWGRIIKRLAVCITWFIWAIAGIVIIELKKYVWKK